MKTDLFIIIALVAFVVGAPLVQHIRETKRRRRIEQNYLQYKTERKNAKA